jgi:DNA-binding CsgD family transcriptional regulator
MYGEYLATRALALAIVGAVADAVETADRAESMTQSSEVHVLTAAVFAIVEIVREPKRGDPAETLLETASSRGVWDGVVCACRASPELLVRLATYPRYRSQLRQTMLRAREDALAASAGLVTRQTGTQRTLSPREREVMEFVRQGSRDADIAASLFISVATVKRHLHNAYAKLGATNRTEATARYAEIENAEAETLASDTRWEV